VYPNTIKLRVYTNPREAESLLPYSRGGAWPIPVEMLNLMAVRGILFEIGCVN
jgi:hypothetical protein